MYIFDVLNNFKDSKDKPEGEAWLDMGEGGLSVSVSGREQDRSRTSFIALRSLARVGPPIRYGLRKHGNQNGETLLFEEGSENIRSFMLLLL